MANGRFGAQALAPLRLQRRHHHRRPVAGPRARGLRLGRAGRRHRGRLRDRRCSTSCAATRVRVRIAPGRPRVPRLPVGGAAAHGGRLAPHRRRVVRALARRRRRPGRDREPRLRAAAHAGAGGRGGPGHRRSGAARAWRSSGTPGAAQEMERVLLRTLQIALGLAVLTGAAAYAAADPLVATLFQRGAFTRPRLRGGLRPAAHPVPGRAGLGDPAGDHPRVLRARRHLASHAARQRDRAPGLSPLRGAGSRRGRDGAGDRRRDRHQRQRPGDARSWRAASTARRRSERWRTRCCARRRPPCQRRWPRSGCRRGGPGFAGAARDLGSAALAFALVGLPLAWLLGDAALREALRRLVRRRGTP